ncbi:hypothetical protein F4779DRAFT_617405 [Xylariaceae sp. FL0662B]|nr:hypothetical protein F4779DRAFT_617405 [Xylariaceae sp. FL0662B]
MSLRTVTVAAILALASISSATKEKAPEDPVLGTDTVHGCYKSKGELKLQMSVDFNSQGKCAETCRDKKYTVGATNARDCYCGNKYPNKSTLTDDSECTEPCPGFGDEACGGLDTYTVYNTGVKVSVGESDEASSSTSSADSSKTSSSEPTSTSDTIETITAPSDADSGSGGTNTTGIAVGVVVGVVVVGGIIGGVFFWMRRKRNAEIEEEHRRNAAVNAFISGGKPPGSSGGLSMSDSRLDPVMNRRMSDGSIADNQDYSRRILRVTNA